MDFSKVDFSKIDFLKEDKARLLPLLVWEARVYMSPRGRLPTADLIQAPVRPAESEEVFAFVRAQFELRREQSGLAEEAYSWEQFQLETGFACEALANDLVEEQLAAPNLSFSEAASIEPPLQTILDAPTSNNHARKHGLYSQKLTLLPEEKPLFDALRADVEQQYRPAEGTERTLTDQIAEATFRMRQLHAYQNDPSEPWANLKPQIRKATRATERRLAVLTARLEKLQTESSR